MSDCTPTAVRRLARFVQWRGVTRDAPRGVYRELASIGRQDCTNEVLMELGWWHPRDCPRCSKANNTGSVQP